MQSYKVESWVQKEFQQMSSFLLWKNERGEYEVFGRYKIIPVKNGFKVHSNNDDEQGFFSSTRTAISWCIADKYNKIDLADQLLLLDNRLNNISNDIFVRLGTAHKSQNADTKENIETKLETKILHKKELEYQLDKCVDWAKYLQKKGFENETSRAGTSTTIKANRSSL